LTDQERRELHILPLPGSLTEALDLMDADSIVREWMPKIMYDSYVSVKRLEVKLMADLDPDEICERYARVY
jgi:glutamine synthetase